MSPRDWQVRLEDILEAIHNLQAYIQDMTFEEFAADTRSVRAAAYDISIIGEAAARIPDDVKTRYPHVPWDKMQAIRNVVVHQYFRLDVGILWQTITQNLPPLVPMLREILKQEG